MTLGGPARVIFEISAVTCLADLLMHCLFIRLQANRVKDKALALRLR